MEEKQKQKRHEYKNKNYIYLCSVTVVLKTCAKETVGKQHESNSQHKS